MMLYNIMRLLSELLIGYLDSLTGHLALAAYLMAVTDERAVWGRLKKLPPLLLSPLVGVLLSMGMYAVPQLRMFQYYILSLVILVMCTLWVRWVWRFGFWQAFAVTCMAGIFQVADTTVTIMMFSEGSFQFAMTVGLHLGISVATAFLLYRMGFGKWFRLLIDNESAPWRTALLLLALEAAMEMFLRLVNGIRPEFLGVYYLLVVVMVVLMAVLMVYLAQRFNAARKIQVQEDIIARQRLYEQDLEIIRQEVRAFRHDYKNLLANLSRQAGEGELEELRRTLSELDVGFDRRIGKKIQVSTQIGNLQIPEARSLLLSKLTDMRKKKVECRLEVLYPVMSVDMDIWDFVRCLGILTDNAMEAALETGEPYVEIVLLVQGRSLFLRVSNPYINTIDPGKMWDEGWSTKGAGRGVGLSGYRRIVDRYPNVSIGTSWESGVFVQELTVEGRP